MAERVMPHNYDAEQAVLGAMFLSKYAAQKCVENLSQELFYSESHQKIFSVVSELIENSKPVDITTVTEELEKKKFLKEIGGIVYLTELVNSVPSASNVDEYIKIVNEKAILRRLILESDRINKQAYDASEELNDILDSAEKGILNVVKTRKGTEFRSIQEVLFKTQSDLEKLAQNKGEITGLSTGFYEIDRITSGLHPNELIIIAARPAMGKTAFALNLATNIAENQSKAVALFNMEMGAEQLAIRMLSSAGQIDQNKLKRGYFEHDDWKRINQAMSRLADTKLFIDDTPGMTMSEIKAKCRRLASQKDGLAIVIIDYLTLIQGSTKYQGNRQQEVSEISRSLKTMAMELEVPVIALAQLSRSVEGREDKRPMLSDLRESGSIEQDADIVAALHAPSVEVPIDENLPVPIQLIILKHRNGPIATIDMLFKKKTSTFLSIKRDGEKNAK